MRTLASLGLLLCCGIAAADPLSDYLFAEGQAWSDRLQLPAAPKAPWIEEAELRLTPEQNDANVASETYSFRFRPTGSKERQAMRDLFRVENELAGIEWQHAVSDAVAGRYRNIIALAELEVRTAVLERQLLFDQSAFAAKSAMSASSSFDNADLQDMALKVERRKQHLQQALQQTAQLRAASVAELLAVENSDVPEVSSQLILPTQVDAMLDAIASDTRTHVGSVAQAEVRRAQSEVALAKSRAGFGINLLELSYEDKALDSQSVTLGFRIPLGRNNFALQKRMRDANIARQHAFLVEQLVDDEVQTAIREMRWKISNYAMDRVAIAAMQQRIAQTPTDLASLVTLRRHQLDLMDSAAATHLDLLRDYIDLLQMLGALQQQRNWIRST